ncbi:MAG: hypothetical protein IIA51_10850 [Chloroflexi bacterium]|nr:hypothetical protein [Chloroflexota bacterium]MDK1045723.1 hypothetical protein [Anaerolineales bacterium]MCH8342038.1 hypothetical protein [Chloroflexota bacterium]MCH8875762.1 hypothetical protein [Chloroflexota bacterium]MCI0771861.1 hypothetical protein [Chloroflexota bacterium]
MSDPDLKEGPKSQARTVGISPGVGCLSTILLAVAGAGLLLVILSVVFRGEARFTKGDLGELRLWMIREPANQGLGLSTTRILSGSESSGQVCIRTTARFLMIRSEQAIPNVSYSYCYERQGENWVEAGEISAPDS